MLREIENHNFCPSVTGASNPKPYPKPLESLDPPGLHLEDLDSRFPDDAASDADVIKLIAELGRKRRCGVRFRGGRYVGCQHASPYFFSKCEPCAYQDKGISRIPLL